MAKQLLTASVAAPGFFGLNTQESSITLAAGFALQADNCVIDNYGRLGARKGWSYVTEGSDGVNLKGGYEFIDIDGTRTMFVWNNTTFYTSAANLLTTLTYTGTNTLTTPNWQAATLNDKLFLFDNNYTPVTYDTVSGQVSDLGASVPKGNCVLSAYGRLWTANTTSNKMTVYWSNLLDGTDFTTGSAGSLDLSAVLVKGTDEIVALGAHSGRLIIFCKDNIVIYDSEGDTLDPVTMSLVEVINDVGCIVRDSIVNTGSDILFLSNTGLMSLGRLIQEKSQPMRDLSKNVRDDLVRDITVSNKANIKTVYHPQEAFYLILLPEYQRIYCFDMRMPLQDGSSRVTLWDTQTQTNMYMFEDELYFTQVNGVAKYRGYTDNGSSYVMKYYTNYFDFDDATRYKMLKRVSTTLIGGSGQDFILKAGYDYSDSYRSFPSFISSRVNAEYGIAEYNTTWEYTIGTLSETVRAPLGGGGNVVQMGFEATINTQPLSLQKLDIYIKDGRIY